MTVLEEIFQLYGERGNGAYFGESVSMTEHGLQAAHFAHAAGSPSSLVVAALLHDVGHLVEEVPDDLADWTTDAGHERIGAEWLARRFPPAVSEPVRLHVPAKRYLLATDPAYLSNLSPASLVTRRCGPARVRPARRRLAPPRTGRIAARRDRSSGRCSDGG